MLDFLRFICKSLYRDRFFIMILISVFIYNSYQIKNIEQVNMELKN